jgi:hypothetical protein
MPTGIPIDERWWSEQHKAEASAADQIASVLGAPERQSQ